MITERRTTSAKNKAASRLTANFVCVHHRNDSHAYKAADAVTKSVSPYFINTWDLFQVEPAK